MTDIRLTSFFQICVYFCIILIVFTMSINVVNALNLFTSVESGKQVTGNDANSVLESITGLSGGMLWVWGIILTTSGIAVLLIAKITASTSIIGVYLFSSIFWTAYNGFIHNANINNWVPNDFFMLFTVGIIFIWVAAIIGMLTGSG